MHDRRGHATSRIRVDGGTGLSRLPQRGGGVSLRSITLSTPKVPTPCTVRWREPHHRHFTTPSRRTHRHDRQRGTGASGMKLPVTDVVVVVVDVDKGMESGVEPIPCYVPATRRA